MAQQITPIAPSLPATTAIQDPAARRFAQAVQDALSALKSEAGAVESLNKAAAALAGAAGGTPAGIAQWLLTSELYQKLKTEIIAVDVQAKQDLLAEAVARQGAIEQIQAILASIEATPDYDPLVTYAVGDMVIYDGKLYRALLETTGNLPTNITYWEKIGDYASLGEVVSAHALAINDLEYNMLDPAGVVQAEVAARQTLATQMRGTYAGTDIAQVTQGLMYSERVARSSAYDAEVAARQSLATKVLGQVDPTGLTLATLTSGLIFEEAQVRSDVDGSLAQTIDALEVTMGENIEAAMLAEQTVRATNDAALVSAINTAWAFTGATQAVSQSGQNLITNWTAAQANKWSQLEAEVFTAGGKTIRAALSEEAQVRANADGSLGAQWTIKTDIDGYVAGFGFASTANNAAPTSEFIIRADKFAVVMPGYGEHVPFAIGPSGAIFTGNTYGAGAPNNLIPDDGFYIPGWWQGNRAVTTWPAGWTPVQGGAGQPAQMLWIDSSAGTFDKSSEWFDIRQGAQYRVRLRMYLSPDFSGFIAPLVHFPGVVWGIPGSAVSDPLGQFPAGHTGESWGRGGWVEREAIYTAGASNCTRLQTRLCGRVTAGHAELYLEVTSLFAGLDQITSSNVTTYIDNAALGNAQIGGNLWSTNWSYADGTGWLLDRDGNFYGNNIYARGDIEASSLKANTAMVQTLNIAGNAVIVPTYVEYPSAAAYNVYQNGTEAEWTLLSDVVTVNVDCSALVFIGCNDPITSTVHTLSVGAGGRGHHNWPTGTEWASVRVYRNGSLVKRFAQWNVTSTKKGTGKHIGTYQESERDCVFIDTLIAEIPLVAGTNTIDIRCWVRMADGDGGARRNSNAYMLIMGAQR